MITFNILDKGKLIASLIKRDSKFKQDVKRNFIFAGEDFIQYIRQRWYDGRNADDTGLNRRTSDLWRAWTPNVRQEGIDIVATVSNNKNYGEKHEKGLGVKRRTFVTDDIKSPEGKKFFSDAVKDALHANF